MGGVWLEQRGSIAPGEHLGQQLWKPSWHSRQRFPAAAGTLCRPSRTSPGQKGKGSIPALVPKRDGSSTHCASAAGLQEVLQPSVPPLLLQDELQRSVPPLLLQDELQRSVLPLLLITCSSSCVGLKASSSRICMAQSWGAQRCSCGPPSAEQRGGEAFSPCSPRSVPCSPGSHWPSWPPEHTAASWATIGQLQMNCWLTIGQPLHF